MAVISTAPARRPAASSPAFTLLEVLLSIVLAALLLAAATQFLLAVSAHWIDQDPRRQFEDHVTGVVRFLESTLKANMADFRLSEEERYPRLGHPPGYPESEDPMLLVRFPDGCPLFLGPSGQTEPVSAWLHLSRDEGLVALWISDWVPDPENLRVNDYQRTVISPWFRGLTLAYYDAETETWEEEDEEPRLSGDGQPTWPDRVVLKFVWDEETRRDVTLALPQFRPDALIY